MTASAIASAINLGVSAQATPSGIHHFEASLLGTELPPEELDAALQHTAFELSDCGFVVGTTLSNLGTRPFVWSLHSMFGMSAGEWRWLPFAGGFVTGGAFDVNEGGVVIGSLGDVSFFEGGTSGGAAVSTRGVAWRVTSTGITAQIIDPPSGWSIPTGSVTFLEAIAADPNHLVAVGYGTTRLPCGGPDDGRYGAFAVDLGTVPPQFWVEPGTDENSSEESVNHRALGIARDAGVIVGSTPNSLCMPTPTCGQLSAPFAWSRGAATPPSGALSGWPLLTNPWVGAANGTITAEARAVTLDGVSIGRVDVPPTAGGFICLPRAHAWKTVVEGEMHAPLFLPPWSASSSIAEDVERAAWVQEGSPNRTVAVGMVIQAGAQSSVGAFWHYAADSTWDVASWGFVDVNPLISSMSGATVLHLKGVNQWGDCVGLARRNTDGKHFPVYLHAVRCAGDLDHSGVVNAADLAALLGYWGGACGDPCSAADLSLDGTVGAPDLAILLGNWDAVCTTPDCAGASIATPEGVKMQARAALDGAIELAGFEELQVYRTWRASVPTILGEMIDQFIWDHAKAR